MDKCPLLLIYVTSKSLLRVIEMYSFSWLQLPAKVPVILNRSQRVMEPSRDILNASQPSKRATKS